MSKLRPNLADGDATQYCPRGVTAYLMIMNSVRTEHGLIHGRLHDHKGDSCAIGSYFNTNSKTALPSNLIDEVAAVNDSMPFATERQRRFRVLKWLRWKLKTLGYKP